MRNWGLLAGLAAILAGLVLAGGEAIVADRTARANGAIARAAAQAPRAGTLPRLGFFAGADLPSAL